MHKFSGPSRDCKESLEAFPGKALKQRRSAFQVEVTGLKPNQVPVARNSVEIVAKQH